MKIDFHSHFFPAWYWEDLRKAGWEAVELRAFIVDLWTTTEERVAMMDEFGVDVNVLSLVAPGVYFSDDQFSLYLAQSTNDFLIEVCRERPDRFYGLASVPLTNVALAIEELHRMAGKPGIVGLCLGTNIDGKALDSEEFYPFYEEVDRLGWPVFLHPSVPVRMSQIEDYHLGPMVAFPFETTLAAARLAYSGTLERFPNMKIVLCHLGGSIPYIIGRLDYGFDKFAPCNARISRPPSYYFRRMYYDTAVCYASEQLMCAIQTVGEDQIVLGTDLPLIKARLGPCMALLASANIGDEVRAKIYEGNARRLLGVESPAREG